jgi:hypothetical protein
VTHNQSLFLHNVNQRFIKNHPNYVLYSKGITPQCIKVMIQYYNIDHNH